MSFDFRTNLTLKKLRADALRFDEWATKKLWGYIFNKFPFSHKRYSVSHEQPPKDFGTLRRGDVIIEDTELVTGELFLLQVWELKHGRATRNDITAVESQSWTMCEEYAMNHHRNTIWCASAFGPYYRMWVYEKKYEMLLPFFPLGNTGERDLYLDLLGSEAEFLKLCKFIKENPFPDVGNLGMIMEGGGGGGG